MLTPQEQAIIEKLDNDLPLTKTIDNLKQGQEEIRKDIQDEREYNKSEFAKGTEKFKEIFSELKEVRSEVKDMKSQISDGFRDMKDEFTKHIADSQDSEISKLNKKLDRWAAIKDGVLVALISGVAVAVILYLIVPAK